MKVLVYGSINIDLTYQMDHIVVPGETISITVSRPGTMASVPPVREVFPAVR